MLWENLELSWTYRLCVKAIVLVITYLLLAASFALFLLVRDKQARWTISLTETQVASRWFGLAMGDGLMATLATKSALAGAAAGVISGVSVAVVAFLFSASTWEGHATQTRQEQSLFAKISEALYFNIVLVPIGVGAFLSYHVSSEHLSDPSPTSVIDIVFSFSRQLSNQSWFEESGTVAIVLLTLASNVIIEEFLKVCDPVSLWNQHVLARFAVSQYKLNQLMATPRMQMGQLFALLHKLCAFCLTCAPLYPPIYLLCAIAMGVKYWVTKYAICRLWRPPPPVEIHLVDEFRTGLAWLVPPHLLMSYLVEQERSLFGDGCLAAAAILWVFYILTQRFFTEGLYEQVRSPLTRIP